MQFRTKFQLRLDMLMQPDMRPLPKSGTLTEEKPPQLQIQQPKLIDTSSTSFFYKSIIAILISPS